MKKTILLILITISSFVISCKSNQSHNGEYRKIEITLPGQKRPISKRIIITIKSDYSIYLFQQKIEKDNLLNELKKIKIQNKFVEVVIDSSKDVKFGFIIEILDIIKSAEINRINLKIISS